MWENTRTETGSSPLTATDAAEFWWEKAEVLAKDAEVAAALRGHAAGWYKVAKQWWNLPGTTVGQKKPNQWGLYDMIGNLEEVVYDSIPPKTPDGQPQRSGSPPQGIDYSDSTDPLVWAVHDGTSFSMARGSNGAGAGWGSSKKGLSWQQRVTCVGFRVVIGPDLVKERALKPLVVGGR